jgi:hypothetical protein
VTYSARNPLPGSLIALLVLAAAPARGALPNPPREDIDFTAEHVPESAMDARYSNLPWLSRPLERGRWEGSLQAGYADTGGSLIQLRGPLLGGGFGYSFRDRWAVAGLGFYDALSFSGGRAREVLHPALHGVPLDLPERADFAHPRGDYRHWGLGAALVHEVARPAPDRFWTASAGLLWERLELRRYQLDYVLAGGANAGAAGVLDHSGSNGYLTPFVGLQHTRPLGRRFLLAPRVVLGAPLPKGDFDERLSGPGFTADSRRGDGRPGAIGDLFVGFGAGVEHRATGLSLDLGSTLYYPLGERVSHAGIDRAIVLQLAWRRAGRRP